MLYGYIDQDYLSSKSFAVRLGGFAEKEDSQGASGSAIADCVTGKVLGILVAYYDRKPLRLHILSAKSFADFLLRNEIELQ